MSSTVNFETLDPSDIEKDTIDGYSDDSDVSMRGFSVGRLSRDSATTGTADRRCEMSLMESRGGSALAVRPEAGSGKTTRKAGADPLAIPLGEIGLGGAFPRF